MSYRRYILLKRYLHFVDNSSYKPGNHPNPKLYNIWPIFQHLNGTYSKLLSPMRDVSVDESLMLYKGRLGWKQYIPQKRARFGIKSFMLCETQSGYIWSIITGKGTKFLEEYEHLPVSSQVVLSLMKPLLGRGYCVVMDNYYSSPQLADILVANKTDTYGTVRINRKEMPSKICIMKWKDKKEVVLLSTVHNLDNVEIKKNEGIRKKPKVVVEYNDTMGGTDKVDQNLTYNQLVRKGGRKYYKKKYFTIF
ncbi:hypothetical protein J437_LFUL017698 [Ladona fulva]|uniref:PiggyBac transposable element-derived protein domain-containing protein n=1 Tax=Ladona fulva TaxID=123851 RepID=A0A8K0KMN1_LADFU|nr:hypothetical protein J437_LFUL017698 [Ladona fulva]